MFSQLLDFLDRNDFNYLARKYDGDKYVKQFTCYNQLATLMFGQLSNRESLRDVVYSPVSQLVFLGYFWGEFWVDKMKDALRITLKASFCGAEGTRTLDLRRDRPAF